MTERYRLISKSICRAMCIVGICSLTAGAQTQATVVVSAATNAIVNVGPQPHYGKISKILAARLPKEHLTQQALGDKISETAWENYLTVLDYHHIYFIESDIVGFRNHRRLIDNYAMAGDLTYAYDVFDVFKQRARERCAFVKATLKKGLDLDKKESFMWNRKDSSWPRDTQEANDLWRKRIKNEYISMKLSREAAKEELAEKEAKAAADKEADEKADKEKESEETVEEEKGAKTDDNAAVKDEKKEEDGALKEVDGPAEIKAEPKTIEEVILGRYDRFLAAVEEYDSQWVLQRYLSSITTAYDPHCTYMAPSVRDNFDIEMKLSLVGIGAVLTTEDGAAKIMKLIPGGPADRDERDIKLKAGDKIIGVGQGDEDPVDIRHWPLYKSVSIIRGEKGTKVVLTVICASDPTGATTRKVDIMRDKVKLEGRSAKQKVREVIIGGAKKKIGIIELPAFYSDAQGRMDHKEDYKSSSRDVRNCLDELKKEDVCGVILDLRSNSGGSLMEAVEMTGLFIHSGPTVIVRGNGFTALQDRDPEIVYDGPLIVLVSRYSASASEILAGALQDYGRAIVVGDSKTHGKGSVQTLLRLDEEDERVGSIKVTTALFYRITGGSTQLTGVTPDITIPSFSDDADVGEDFLPNPLPWTSIRPIRYRRYADFAPLVSLLLDKAEKRRGKDKRFKDYVKLLARIDDLNDEKILSLNIDDRRKRQQTKKELQKLRKKVIDDAGDGDDSDKDDKDGKDEEDDSADIILTECLQILIDMVSAIGFAVR